MLPSPLSQLHTLESRRQPHVASLSSLVQVTLFTLDSWLTLGLYDEQEDIPAKRYNFCHLSILHGTPREDTSSAVAII